MNQLMDSTSKNCLQALHLFFETPQGLSMHLLHSSHEVCNTFKKITLHIYIPNPHYVMIRITLLSITLKTL